PDALGTQPPPRSRRLDHDPKKWSPVFGQDHGQSKRQGRRPGMTLPPMHETMILVIGLVGVLSTASLVAGILSWRAPKPLSSTLVNLNQRINAWWVMVVAITVAFFFGHAGMT